MTRNRARRHLAQVAQEWPKTAAELAARQKRHAQLAAEIAEIETSGPERRKASLAEVGPSPQPRCWTTSRQPAGKILQQLRQLGSTRRHRAGPAPPLPRGTREQDVRATGTLPTLSRDETLSDPRSRRERDRLVSKHTDYVLAGESAGSKFDKARALGVPTLNEQEFIVLLGGEKLASSGTKQKELF